MDSNINLDIYGSIKPKSNQLKKFTNHRIISHNYFNWRVQRASIGFAVLRDFKPVLNHFEWLEQFISK